MSVRVRFAPSPTGFLHIGGARTALYNWLFARHESGKFILRIEDTDRKRYVPEAVEDITESLRWLGLDWDEGPVFQSQRLELYRRHAQILLEKGYAYKCFCSPERLEKVRETRRRAGLKTGYDRHCRNLSPEEVKRLEAEGKPYVIRLKMPLSGEIKFRDAIRGVIKYDARELEDIILLKSDGWPTYHLANVVDDHHMGITHVMRAEEWIPSTPYHVFMYEAFGWEPPVFAHLPVILSPEGGKLSKRHGAVSVREFKEQGFLPEALVNYIALLGWSPGDDREIMSLREMVEAFDLRRVSKKAAAFDYQKLLWMNGEYIRAKSPEELFQLAWPFFQRAGFTDPQLVRRIIPLYQERAKTLKEMAEMPWYFLRDPETYDEKGVKKHFKPEVAGWLRELAKRLEELGRWEAGAIEETLRGLADELGVKHAKLIHPTRLAVSGVTFGPGLFELLEALGKEKVVKRLLRAAEFIDAQTN